MFRLVVFVVAALALFTGFAYFQIYQEAGKFTNRIQLEALELFDRRDGLDFVTETVKKIAESENIELVPGKLNVRMIATTDHQAASLVDIAVPDTGKETLAVTTTFKIKRSFVSQTFTRSATKVMTGADRRATRSSGGFSSGVNISRPTRDINSHRQTIKRAVSGKNP